MKREHADEKKKARSRGAVTVTARQRYVTRFSLNCSRVPQVRLCSQTCHRLTIRNATVNLFEVGREQHASPAG